MATNLRGTPSSLQRRNRKIAWFKTGIVLLTIFCISGATIAWTSPPALLPAVSTQSTPEEAGIEVTVTAADRVEYGQALNIIVTITNVGDIPVKNAHLFSNANPGGYFTLRVVDRSFVELDRNNIDINLDDLSPGSQTDINMFLQAPMAGQIQGEWSHNFHYDFTIKHDGASKSPVGTITLTARHGKIFVQTSGFGQ